MQKVVQNTMTEMVTQVSLKVDLTSYFTNLLSNYISLYYFYFTLYSFFLQNCLSSILFTVTSFLLNGKHHMTQMFLKFTSSLENWLHTRFTFLFFGCKSRNNSPVNITAMDYVL